MASAAADQLNTLSLGYVSRYCGNINRTFEMITILGLMGKTLNGKESSRCPQKIVELKQKCVHLPYSLASRTDMCAGCDSNKGA